MILGLMDRFSVVQGALASIFFLRLVFFCLQPAGYSGPAGAGGPSFGWWGLQVLGQQSGEFLQAVFLVASLSTEARRANDKDPVPGQTRIQAARQSVLLDWA